MATSTTLSTTLDDERLVQTLSISLAENLLHHYPHGDNASLDCEQVQGWLLELHETYKARPFAAQRHGDNDRDALRQVMKLGIQQWKSQQSTLQPLSNLAATVGNKSINFMHLFGTTATSGLLASIVTWDRIQQEPTQLDQLHLLLKVKHVDDIHPDWEPVNKLLQQGLQHEVVPDNGPVAVATQFIQLHQTLFEQSRSPEYTAAQIDLCRNIVQLLPTIVQLLPTISPTDQQQQHCDGTAVVSLFGTMWLDWMLARGGGPDANVNRVESIGRAVWQLYCGTDSSSETSAVVYPCAFAQVMLEQDPDAHWFTSWMAHLPAVTVVDLVESNAASLALVCAMVRHCEEPQLTHHHHHEISSSHIDASRRHALQLLASILRHTRHLFPFRVIEANKKENDDNDDTDAALQSLARLVAVYIEALTHTDRTLATTGNSTTGTDNGQSVLMVVYADALETLLSVCSKMDSTLYSTLLVKAETMSLPGAAKLIPELLGRLRRNQVEVTSS
jgi:hypothetical protein